MRQGCVALRAWTMIAAMLLAAGCAADASSGSAVRARKQTTADRKCATLPACQAYLEQVRQRVYENWSLGASAAPGTVLIGLKLDVNGNASAVRAIRASSEELGRSCRSAVAYAAPFGPLPASLGFLDGEPITLEISVPPPVAGGSRKPAKPRR